MAVAPNVDRSVLAGRIQGYGNFNPPAPEDDTAGTVAKRAVGRLGDLVGEEVMLTVDDFREKGAVGAVKDAVADAGDILVDGVSAVVGWIRGDPPLEEDTEASEFANSVLANGPAGAAYGISQASPTGGINAVWVMPEDADPAALMQLTAQNGGLPSQQLDPRVPRNIQPYQPDLRPAMAPAPQLPSGLPGGPVIAPYQPAPSGPGNFRGGAYSQPTGLPNLPSSGVQLGGRWSPGGFTPGAGLASSNATAASSSAPVAAAAPSAAGGNASIAAAARGLVDRVARGEVLAGPETAKRLASQCAAARISASQLGEILVVRVHRLYLGLEAEGSGPAIGDADAALARLLALTDVLLGHGTDFTRGAVQVVVDGAAEELLSLRSNAEHRVQAETILARLGLFEQEAQPARSVASRGAAVTDFSDDLLGDVEPPSFPVHAAEPQLDLLGGEEAPVAGIVAMADLLGSDEEGFSAVASAVDAEFVELFGGAAVATPPQAMSTAAGAAATVAPCADADLLGDALHTGEESADLLGTDVAPAAPAPVSLDPLAPNVASSSAGAQVAPAGSAALFEGLDLGVSSGGETASAAESGRTPVDLAKQEGQKPVAAFSFVGEEILKAKGEA